jgi:hypothetical protein
LDNERTSAKYVDALLRRGLPPGTLTPSWSP